MVITKYPKTKRRKSIKKKRLSSQMLRLGEYLKDLRKDVEMSLREVTKQTHLTPAQLSKIEAGHVKSISIETLVQLAAIYKISVHDILHATGFFKNGECDENGLPDFATYLRIKYRLPYQAVHDMELAKEIITQKYHKE